MMFPMSSYDNVMLIHYVQSILKFMLSNNDCYVFVFWKSMFFLMLVLPATIVVTALIDCTRCTGAAMDFCVLKVLVLVDGMPRCTSRCRVCQGHRVVLVDCTVVVSVVVL